MKKEIQDIAPGLIGGVDVQMPGAAQVYRENWFEWRATTLRAGMKQSTLAGGVLNIWKHTPVFAELEYHEDCEMFYFVQGTAIMPFADIKDGKIDMDSVQLVRVPAGTQIVIQPGKAHFVAVAQDDTPVTIIVASPVMDAPRLSPAEPLEGILEI
ncbi:hypothetical protein [Clostridium sp. KNHs216]|uniref:hypothetical protein n=1 Tax=Clostridium sp. KNHs216 TaxID=1550235 RepID=UPI00114DD5CF|nr:hypothetical protein [Clostridium sp. KNHs216]TQI66854.1 hypothetical protein LY85_1536 [Clostridium sp. KNHs216]